MLVLAYKFHYEFNDYTFQSLCITDSNLEHSTQSQISTKFNNYASHIRHSYNMPKYEGVVGAQQLTMAECQC